jgi:hypothetical protein
LKDIPNKKKVSTFLNNLKYLEEHKMSFLTRTVPLTTARATGTIIAPSSVLANRSFSTTRVAQKGPVEATKDTIKKVDRTVANAAVKGIETGGTYLFAW